MDINVEKEEPAIKAHSHYLVLARKYRPQIFDEICGQNIVVQSLKNAILSNQIPHSFLFAGPRGVGKTSTARILAKSLNCLKGISPYPCNKCKNCLEITNSHSLDVLEIDGASNTGVDNIRDLKEKAYNNPINSRFKIYIIDEVHMLSNSAFNALLKILEEPPSHLIFIFATTELHKIPETIISRCQVFKFERISDEDIVKNLAKICKKENILLEKGKEKEILYAIASASQGGMRDALVFLDQLSLFLQKKLTLEKVYEFLEKTGFENIKKLIPMLFMGNIKDSIQFLHKAFEKGANLENLTAQLLEEIRIILLYKNGISNEKIEETIRHYSEDFLQKIDLKLLVYASDLIMKTMEQLKLFPSSLFLLESLFIKISKFNELINFTNFSKNEENSKMEIEKEKEETNNVSIKSSILKKFTEEKIKEKKEEKVSLSHFKNTDELFEYIFRKIGEKAFIFSNIKKYLKIKNVQIRKNKGVIEFFICPTYKNGDDYLNNSTKFKKAIQELFLEKVEIKIEKSSEEIYNYADIDVKVKENLPQKYWDKIKLLKKYLKFDILDIGKTGKEMYQ